MLPIDPSLTPAMILLSAIDLQALMTIPNVLILALIIYSVVLHEAAHAFMADYFGDHTARMLGRCTLDPQPHVKETPLLSLGLPLITWIMYGGHYALACGSCPINPRVLQRHRWGEFWVNAAGPAVNLALALVFAGLLVFVPGQIDLMTFHYGTPYDLGESILYIAYWMILAQLVIALFNLMPIPPMDGAGIFVSLFPNSRAVFNDMTRRFGLFLPILIGWPLFRYATPYIYDLLHLLVSLHNRMHGY